MSAEKMENIANIVKTFTIIIVVYVVTYVVMYVFSMLVFGLVTLVFDHSGEIMAKCKKFLADLQEKIKQQIHKVSVSTKKYVEPDTRSGIWYNFNRSAS